jgi:predicted acyltransferase
MQTIEHAAPRRVGGRLTSLDAFRGLAILGMLLVNNKALGPATPHQLTHAGWGEGVHFADLVFPWFLFIVGVAIPYAAASRRSRGMTWRCYHLAVLGRAGALVLLGCLINSSYARRPLFDLGVLQLIGLAYLVGTFLYPLPSKPRLAVAAALMVTHWAVIRFVPIPGADAGVFTREQNVIAYLDRVYLEPYSLAGIISLATISALVLMGTAAGDFLRRESYPPVRKAGLLLLAGAGLAVGGWLWSLDLEFSKQLWSAPFVVLSAGSSLLLLGLLYLLIDVKGWRAWAFPLVVTGRNAIFVFVGSMLVNLHILREWHWAVHGGATLPLEEAIKRTLFAQAGRVPGGFLYTFGYIFAWWLVLLWMYRKRVFLRV